MLCLRGFELYSSWVPPLYYIYMVTHNCHGKTKNLTAKTTTSRQNQKPHGKNKIPHGKTKNLTAKPNTSQQKQNSFGFAVGICFCREVFGFCCEVFGFAVRSLVLPWRLGFCLFVFSVRFSGLPWGILLLPRGFWFCRDSCGPPYIYTTCLMHSKTDIRSERKLSTDDVNIPRPIKVRLLKTG